MAEGQVQGRTESERDFAIGLRSGIFDPRHVEAIGPALWAFAWCVRKQTDEEGRVLGGAVLTYGDIAEGIGTTERRARDWICRLRAGGYLLVEQTQRGLVLRVVNAKKAFLGDGKPSPKMQGDGNPAAKKPSPRRKTVTQTDGKTSPRLTEKRQSLSKDETDQETDQETQSNNPPAGLVEGPPQEPEAEAAPKPEPEPESPSVPAPAPAPAEREINRFTVEDLAAVAASHGFVDFAMMSGALMSGTNSARLMEVLKLGSTRVDQAMAIIAQRKPEFWPTTPHGWLAALLGATVKASKARASPASPAAKRAVWDRQTAGLRAGKTFGDTT